MGESVQAARAPSVVQCEREHGAGAVAWRRQRPSEEKDVAADGSVYSSQTSGEAQRREAVPDAPHTAPAGRSDVEAKWWKARCGAG